MANRRTVPDTARLDALLAGVEIVSPAAFRIGGGSPVDVATIPAFRPAGNSGLQDDCTLPRLRDALATALYFVGYAQLYRGQTFDPASLNSAVAPDGSFIAALAAANPSKTGWEPGWRVFQLDPNGAVHVAKGERARLLQPGRYAFRALGRPPGIGDVVDLARERESLSQQPGLYFAFGDTVASDYDQARTARLYFNADAAGAEWLLRRIGCLLNRFRIPYSFKCPTDPRAFDRFDSVVLYLARRFVPAVLDLLWSAGDDMEVHLRQGIPLFTRALMDGLGAADEPGTGESFGQSRSRLLATALVDGWTAGRTDPASLRTALAARFSKAGLNIERSHLAAGLTDIYDWRAEAA